MINKKAIFVTALFSTTILAPVVSVSAAETSNAVVANTTTQTQPTKTNVNTNVVTLDNTKQTKTTVATDDSSSATTTSATDTKSTVKASADSASETSNTVAAATATQTQPAKTDLNTKSVTAADTKQVTADSATTSAMTTSATDVKNAVADNIKSSIDVPASYLANADFPGPFTAGVNQVIPFEAFGGDGMLTRLLLNASDGAGWSDNGADMNAALLPLDGLTAGAYTYEVDLAGAAGKLSDGDLLNYLKSQGTKSYQATVKVYDANKAVVATKAVTINLQGTEMTTSADAVKNAVADNIKSSIDVPASYLANADFPGPFTAGVNQVIPFEAFGGDGMLTRLLLNASDKAAWSDNGADMNAALLPLDGLTAGAYTYEVDLVGAAGKLSDGDLLNYLKEQGTKSYQAMVKVYDANGKVVATKTVMINLNGTMAGGMTMNPANMADGSKSMTNPGATMGGSKMMPMSSSMMNNNASGMMHTNAMTHMMANQNKQASLPNTGETSGIWLTISGAVLAALGVLGAAFKFLRH